jgi:hypothetical protein
MDTDKDEAKGCFADVGPVTDGESVFPALNAFR